MKYNVKITNLSFDIELTPIEIEIPVEPIEPIPEPEPPIEIQWNGNDLELLGGQDYFIPYHTTPKIENKTVNISSKGEGRANLFFGVEGMSNWSRNHSRFLFDAGNYVEITFRNVNPYTVNVASEVDPFYHTIFTGSGINQKFNLINCDTNMQLALLYSASQEVTQVLYQENVTFKGYIYQELKANNGGGLKSIIRKAELTQIDPLHYFESTFNFSLDSVHSSIPFSAIENSFHSQQKQNACNIIYVEGMTFCLPWGLEISNTHKLRTIPKVGEVITLNQGPEFLQSNEWELQAGDIIEIEGKDYTIISKDRPRQGFKESGYAIDYNVEKRFVGSVAAIVKKSQGERLIGKESKGYMIFKDNKPFHTNINEKFELDYYLKSNPMGVLSYNHKEITVDWENLNHDGFYRQSKSGKGNSNGYRIVNCKGLEDEFNPPVEIIIE